MTESVRDICSVATMMTSSNGNIFRVTGHLCGEFTGDRPVTRSFDVFFDLRPNKQLSKQWWGWWFEMPSWSAWRHCNALCKQYQSHLSVPFQCRKMIKECTNMFLMSITINFANKVNYLIVFFILLFCSIGGAFLFIGILNLIPGIILCVQQKRRMREAMEQQQTQVTGLQIPVTWVTVNIVSKSL